LLQAYIEQLHDLFHLEIKTYSTYVYKTPLLGIHWQAGIFHYNSFYQFFVLFFKRHFIKPPCSTSSPILITIFIPYGEADKKQCRFDNQKAQESSKKLLCKCVWEKITLIIICWWAFCSSRWHIYNENLTVV